MPRRTLPAERLPKRSPPRGPANAAEAAVAPRATLPTPAGATTMPAGLFKARCLELMDRVRDEGGEIVITKYGRPVAKLVPVTTEEARGFGALRETVRRYGDLVSPVDAPWEADRG